MQNIVCFSKIKTQLFVFAVPYTCLFDKIKAPRDESGVKRREQRRELRKKKDALHLY